MDEDEDFAKRFALKPIKPDERMHQVRYLRPELVEKVKKAIKRDIAKGFIKPDHFNNKGKKRWKKRKLHPMEE